MKEPTRQPRRKVRLVGGGGFFENPVYILIILNLIVFLASFVNSDKLVFYFGFSPSLFTEHPWTILTNMFVHVSFWHIFGNMLVLFFFGRVVYRLIGARWFLLIYFVGGIVGNLLYYWLGDPFSFAIGASGAIYALAGALVVMMPNMKVYIWGILPMPLWAWAIIFMGLWSIPNFMPGIAWQGHLGGVVIGLAAGFFFRRRMRFISFS